MSFLALIIQIIVDAVGLIAIWVFPVILPPLIVFAIYRQFISKPEELHLKLWMLIFVLAFLWWIVHEVRKIDPNAFTRFFFT